MGHDDEPVSKEIVRQLRNLPRVRLQQYRRELLTLQLKYIKTSPVTTQDKIDQIIDTIRSNLTTLSYQQQFDYLNLIKTTPKPETYKYILYYWHNGTRYVKRTNDIDINPELIIKIILHKADKHINVSRFVTRQRANIPLYHYIARVGCSITKLKRMRLNYNNTGSFEYNRTQLLVTAQDQDHCHKTMRKYELDTRTVIGNQQAILTVAQLAQSRNFKQLKDAYLIAKFITQHIGIDLVTQFYEQLERDGAYYDGNKHDPFDFALLCFYTPRQQLLLQKALTLWTKRRRHYFAHLSKTAHDIRLALAALEVNMAYTRIVELHSRLTQLRDDDVRTLSQIYDIAIDSTAYRFLAIGRIARQQHLTRLWGTLSRYGLYDEAWKPMLTYAQNRNKIQLPEPVITLTHSAVKLLFSLLFSVIATIMLSIVSDIVHRLT